MKTEWQNRYVTFQDVSGRWHAQLARVLFEYREAEPSPRILDAVCYRLGSSSSVEMLREQLDIIKDAADEAAKRAASVELEHAPREADVTRR